MTSLNDKENMGPLPENWESVALKEVVSKLVDGSHNPPKKTNYGFPMLSARNIKNNQIVFDKFRFISENDFKKEHTRTRIDPGDVLLTIVGTIGRSAVVPAGLKDFTLQRSVAILTPLKILPKYLMYQLQSPFIQRHFVENARGTAQKGVYLKTLGQTPIRVAPLEQQKRIVAEIEKQFSRLDEAVANLKRVKANLKRYKAAVLKAAVEGKLTEEWRKQHPDVEPAAKLLERINTERKERYKAQLWEWKEVVKSWELSEKRGKKPAKPRKTKELLPLRTDELDRLPGLPSEWTWLKLGNFNLEVFDGPFGSNLKSSDYVRQGVRVIRLENIGELEFIDRKRTYVSESKYLSLEKHKVSFGDIIFSSFIAGSTRVVVLPKHIEAAVNKADCFCVRVHGEIILNRFLEIFFGSRCSYEQLVNEIHGATRPRINTTQLKNCATPLCSPAEQSAIVAEVDRRVSLLKEIEREVDANIIRAEHLRQSILKKAFSGRLLEPKTLGEK